MSFPDPSPPLQSHAALTSPPLGGGGGEDGGFWPPFMIGADQQQHQSQHMDSIPIPQFDHHYQHNPNQIQNLNHNNPPPFKRLRPSDKSQNYPQMNPRTTNPPNLPGGNRGTSHIFFKTRICAKFMDGTCRNGEHCTFAHGPEDLREPPPNWQELIREKERGTGIGPWSSDDQRMIHRMKICKKYYNGEECPYGDKCNFLHERPPQPPLKKFKPDVPLLGPGIGMMGHRDRESAVISIGTMGDHRASGEQGTFWKTKVCSKWEIGQCPFGDRCHFAHGHSDLKMVDEAEMAASGISRKPVAFVQHSAAPVVPNMVVGGGGGADGEEEKKSSSKWKLTKKINRIYADWLDDMSPPRGVPDEEEI